MGHSAAIQQNQQIPKMMMMYITREQSPPVLLQKKYPRKFGSCLPHIAFSKSRFFFFRLLEACFRGMHSASLAKPCC